MRWDIFCKVIDNHGDIGVCWRLSRDLASRGHSVRLWVDDRSAMAWMAPEVQPDGRGHAGIEIRDWPSAVSPLPEDVDPAEVVIEAFGCDLPADFVKRMQRPEPPCWLNLEYLSAEDYVERSHGLTSPIFSGPGTGLKKRFFYPGFTPRTGGLLREAGWLARVATLATSDEKRQQALRALGVNWQPGRRLATLFCYEHSPVESLLRQLSSNAAQIRTAEDESPWLVLLTPGHASQQAAAIEAQGLDNLPGLQLQHLPALPQPDFDTLLACSDLNFVRGEDSAVRALWAGRPHVWQIYRQDDGVHAEKLHAFMDRWMVDWPAPLRQAVTALWAQWNALPGLSSPGDAEAPPAPDLSALGPLLDAQAWRSWQQGSLQSSQNLACQDDLVTQLLAFVCRPG